MINWHGQKEVAAEDEGHQVLSAQKKRKDIVNSAAHLGNLVLFDHIIPSNHVAVQSYEETVSSSQEQLKFMQCLFGLIDVL